MVLSQRWYLKGVMVLVSLVAVAGITLGNHPPVVSAHPLGNFTINHYSRVEVATDTVSLRYVLDMAEIPAFQEKAGIDLDKDGYLSDQERKEYLDKKPLELLPGLNLTLNESPVALTLNGRELSFPQGQGGLSTLRLDLQFQGQVPQPQSADQRVLEYRDKNYPNRIGWKEVVVQAGDGIALLTSTAPQRDRSDELRSYPAELALSPLDQRYARATFAIAGTDPSQDVQPPEAGQGSGAPSTDLLSSLITREQLSLPLLALSLLVALGLGALHAVSPGHGKTIMAAYLVGTRGNAIHAVFLGMTVTVSHTLGVVILGLVVLYASHLITPETLYPWLGVASGVTIIAIGIGLILNRMRSRQLGAGHEHVHAHPHPHPHGHHNVELENRGGLRITWRSLAALGVIGGLVPSTSALVLLLAAISMQRVGVGLLLVLAFSTGMALVLGGTGLALVFAARSMEKVRFQTRWVAGITRELSLIAALVVLASGVVMMGRGLQQLGLG